MGSEMCIRDSLFLLSIYIPYTLPQLTQGVCCGAPRRSTTAPPHEISYPSLDDQDPWTLTQSYGVSLVLIREGSHGQIDELDTSGYPLNVTL